MQRLLTTLAVGVALAFAAAAPATARPTPVDWNDFTDSEWRLLDAGGHAVPEVKVNVSWRGLTYHNPCYSRGYGVFSLAGRLTIYGPGMTSTCGEPPEALRAKHAAFEAALLRVTRAQWDGGRLTLLDAEGHRQLNLKWIRPVDFEGRTWRVTAYAGGEGLIHPPTTQRVIDSGARRAPWAGPTFYVGGGELSGETLCYGLNGSYRRDGNWLDLYQGGYIIAGFCFPEHTELDRPLRSAFAGRLQFRRHGDGWIVTDEAGGTRAVLAPTTPDDSPFRLRDHPDVRGALAGHRWRIVRSAESGRLAPPLPPDVGIGVDPNANTIGFWSNGHLRMHGACDMSAGHYELVGSALYLSDNNATACDEPPTGKRDPMLELAERVTSAEARGRHAWLKGADGRVLFELELMDVELAE